MGGRARTPALLRSVGCGDGVSTSVVLLCRPSSRKRPLDHLYPGHRDRSHPGCDGALPHLESWSLGPGPRVVRVGQRGGSPVRRRILLSGLPRRRCTWRRPSPYSCSSVISGVGSSSGSSRPCARAASRHPTNASRGCSSSAQSRSASWAWRSSTRCARCSPSRPQRRSS